MEYYNGILCISGSQLIISEDNPKGLLSLPNYKYYISKNRLNVIRRGCYGTPALIAFDSLPPKYKKLAKERFGDPEVESQKKGIINYLEHDKQAVEFFKNHRVGYDDNAKGLPPEIQQLYSNNAAVLNAIKKAWDEHVVRSKSRNKRPLSGKFWRNAALAHQNLPKE